MASLFRYGDFQAASGQKLRWKIECDSLTESDWDCIARVSAPAIGPFRYLFGVPKGGLVVAKAFEPYADPTSEIALIVDDVWTTGKSMYDYVNRIVLKEDWKGFVAFARGPFPEHRIKCFMKTEM